MKKRTERPRDRFDIPAEWRKEQEKRLRALLVPQWSKFMPPHVAREYVDKIIPFHLDEAARIAHEWLRRHQLGDEFVRWVDPAAEPTDPEDV